MKYIIALVLAIAIFVSCKNRNQYEKIANDKDPACGMPVSGIVSDTCHYAGKAYGFCSKYCKQTFQNDPGMYVKE